MSRIYFHTPERTVEVLGSERAYMNIFVADVALGVLRVRHDDQDWLRSVVKKVEYDLFEREGWWQKDFETWFRVGGDGGAFLVRGEMLGAHELAANTLIAMRSPTMSLFARLEGMCEDFAWIDAADAAWFAGVLEDGLDANIFRTGQGWEGVAELAREVASGAPGPIVTSFSGAESFPNRYVIGEPWFYRWSKDQESNPPDEDAEEGWEALTEAERWALAVPAINARKYNRQISLDAQNDGFMSGASVFDLIAERWADRAKAKA